MEEHGWSPCCGLGLVGPWDADMRASWSLYPGRGQVVVAERVVPIRGAPECSRGWDLVSGAVLGSLRTRARVASWNLHTGAHQAVGEWAGAPDRPARDATALCLGVPGGSGARQVAVGQSLLGLSDLSQQVRHEPGGGR